MTKAGSGSSVGDDLIRAMEEALAHARGDKAGARESHYETSPVAVKTIRKRVGLNQDDFASLLGISVSGLRKWEQGRRQPHGAARTLLRVMEREPEAVVRAISAHD